MYLCLRSRCKWVRLWQVQKAWMYLENIFAGSEDIRRQLPAESQLFDSVNSNWKFVMERMSQDPNAHRATHVEGLLPLLNEMNSKLEKIQKSLDQYLETKRQKFPRFYFISNDDLLEILGEARDPKAIQPHLKKLFEAIDKLKFEPTNRKTIDAQAIISPEQEVVTFQSPVQAEGPECGLKDDANDSVPCLPCF